MSSDNAPSFFSIKKSGTSPYNAQNYRSADSECIVVDSERGPFGLLPVCANAHLTLRLTWDNGSMQATVELPEVVLQQLETLARREGATPGDLIRRIVEDHVARNQPVVRHTFNVSLPLIPSSETGPIRAITGEDVDELLSDDRLTA